MNNGGNILSQEKQFRQRNTKHRDIASFRSFWEGGGSGDVYFVRLQFHSCGSFSF